MTIISRFDKISLFLFALFLPLQTRYFITTGIREYESIVFYATDLLFLWLVLIFSLKNKKERWLGLAWAIGLLAFYQSSRSTEWYGWLRLAEAASVGYLVLKNNALKSWLIIGLIIGALGSSLLAMWQFYAQEIIAHPWFGLAAQAPWRSGVAVLETNSGRLLRSYGPFSHPNILGGYLTVALLFLFSFKDEVRQFFRHRVAWWGAVAILTSGIFLSFSRSAWLALIVGVVWLAIIKKISYKAVALGVGGFLILIFSLWPFVGGRFLINNRLEAKSVAARTASNKAALEIIKTHPWFGVGLGQFTRVALDLSLQDDPRYVEPVHNVFLLVLSEIGLVGFLVLLLLGGWFLKQLAPTQYPLLVAIGIIGLFDHYWWTYNSTRLLLVMVLAYFQTKRAK